MKVRELIEELSAMNLDAQVHFSYDYGDRSHTSVAPVVNNVEEKGVRHSEYFRSDVVIKDDEDAPKAEVKFVVVISA